MKKVVFSIFSFLLLIGFSNAQTAQEWMDKVSENYQKIPNYYIKFELKESGTQNTHTGELFASRDKYSLDVMDIMQMYDGKMLYTVMKEDKEVTISSPSPDSDDLFTPTKILKMYKSGIQLNLGKSEKFVEEKIQFIKIKSTDN